MRKPGEYIASALRGVMRSMSDCSMTLTRGTNSATVTRAASVLSGEDSIGGDEPAEKLRVLAAASDFEDVTKGELVGLNDEQRIVTSVRTDCARVSCYIGLSDALSETTVAWSGARKTRGISFPLDVLAVDNGISTEPADEYGSAYTVHSWIMCIPREAWPSAGEPEVGDTARMVRDDGGFRVLKVSRVVDKGGYFLVDARSR